MALFNAAFAYHGKGHNYPVKKSKKATRNKNRWIMSTNNRSYIIYERNN